MKPKGMLTENYETQSGYCLKLIKQKVDITSPLQATKEIASTIKQKWHIASNLVNTNLILPQIDQTKQTNICLKFITHKGDFAQIHQTKVYMLKFIKQKDDIA